MREPDLTADLDPRNSFGAAVSVYLRSLYPVDTASRVLSDMLSAGFRGKTAAGVAQILNGSVDARALDELIGTYRMAVVVGASELLLGESVEDFIERRTAGGPLGMERVRVEGVGYAMLHEAMAQAKVRSSL